MTKIYVKAYFLNSSFLSPKLLKSRFKVKNYVTQVKNYVTVLVKKPNILGSW